eukprot:3198861-Amphidinium_carterae.1
MKTACPRAPKRGAPRSGFPRDVFKAGKNSRPIFSSDVSARGQNPWPRSVMMQVVLQLAACVKEQEKI